MYSHAPEKYVCPICAGIRNDDENTLIRPSDFVFKSQGASAIINSFFREGNEGHIIVFPNEHFENIYNISDEILNHIGAVSKKISIAMKSAYRADGITILQNNEPASEQHAFHYHLHIFPRYEGDNFHQNFLNKINTTPEDRKKYADKISESLNG